MDDFGPGEGVSDRLLDERELERGALLALLTAGYAAWAMISILLFRFDDGQAGSWLPNEFCVAIILRNRRLSLLPAVAAVLVGCLAANFLLASTLSNALFFSGANASSVLAEVTLLRRVTAGRGLTISGARDYAAMLLAGGVAGPALAAALF